MNRHSSPWFVVAVGGFMLGGIVVLQGQNAVVLKPAVIAVVDVQKVVADMAQRKAIDAELVRRRDELEREKKLESEKAIQMEGLYRKVTDAVARLAKQNGYDLVLYKDETDAARGKTQQQIATIITLRKVIYSAPELDITSQVTQLLNDEFNAKK